MELEKQQLYFADMMQAAQALVRVFKPVKMNYQILGNSSPHLHCILQPRFYGDSEPGWPIDPYKEKVILTSEEYKERIKLIRAALDCIQ
ncbi:MAG: hypothetical protein GY847_00160 [Proteobacteria bacterium]|nr:hypothetical protein [Pseudomonadota bacterium]